jgi:hypothetical protein
MMEPLWLGWCHSGTAGAVWIHAATYYDCSSPDEAAPDPGPDGPDRPGWTSSGSNGAALALLVLLGSGWSCSGFNGATLAKAGSPRADRPALALLELLRS